MNILNERIDDIPLIISYLIKKKVGVLFDLHLKNHGNQNTLSNGEVVVIWLAYILSEGDHRKAHVKDWVESRHTTLSACIGKQFDVNNFTDDRLSRLLYRCSSDVNWNAFEDGMAKETVSLIPVEASLESFFENGACDVIKGVFKLDGSAVCGHHEVSQDGIMQFGYSKDHRPDLPQTKIMHCSEGFSGCPVITEIDRGNVNDERMYEPVLNRMRKVFDTKNFLFCGDSKMSIKKLREGIQRNNEFYLCPLQLSNIKVRKTFNEEWVTDAINGSKPITQIYSGEDLLGYGYELTREQMDSKGELQWNERVLIVKSLGYFKGEKKRFEKELSKSKKAILKLSSKICKTSEEAELLLKNKLATHLDKNPLTKGMYIVETEVEEICRKYERTEERNNKKRSGSYELKKYRSFVKTLSIDESFRESYLERLGWRAYVTNVPSDLLSYSGAYLYYRKTQYVIEEGFHMLKSKPIGIRPLYVSRDDQIIGLLRLMTLGVMFLKILSLEITIALRERQEVLMGLTAGQPKRKTEKPTAVSVLSYFYRSYITLSSVEINGKWKNSITKLPDLCCKILNMIGLSESIYYQISDFKNKDSRANDLKK